MNHSLSVLITATFNMFNDSFGLAEVITVKHTQESLPQQTLRMLSMPLPYWVEELVESGEIKAQVEAALAETASQEGGHLSSAIFPHHGTLIHGVCVTRGCHI